MLNAFRPTAGHPQSSPIEGEGVGLWPRNHVLRQPPAGERWQGGSERTGSRDTPKAPISCERPLSPVRLHSGLALSPLPGSNATASFGDQAYENLTALSVFRMRSTTRPLTRCSLMISSTSSGDAVYHVPPRAWPGPNTMTLP